MNSIQRSVALARVCARQYSAPSAQFQALKKKQAKFQIDDGIPVFLKGGAMDKLFFQSTVFLIFVGSGMMVKLFWDLSVPKK